MNAERQRLAEEIFKQALSRPVDERRRFAEQRCGSDAELAHEVLSLLSWSKEESGVLDRPPPFLDGVTEADAAAALLPPGGSIGQYKVLSVLGVGGMGVVYVAQQRRPQRTVALKVIRPGLATPSVLRRLEYEAELLGRLQHPGIAQVIEAGSADAGFGPQPYFAMELVKGSTLDAYGASHTLGVRERLKLVVQICEAVEHAHRRGVLHRDLKPSNILVDESGAPKVLDFGVARATQTREDEQRLTMLHSGERQLIGTLAYMSPEQVGGDPDDVDFRSDVYALGVILFELVAGRPPHDIARRSLPDAIRVIRDGTPLRLGAVLPACRGDLDTIAAKALERDKHRRYQSAAELGADLERFLSNRPIAARPPSAAYQFRKFASRNKAIVAGASIAFVSLVAGLVVSTIQSTRATRAAAKSEQVAALLKGMIGGINPVVAQARDTTLLNDIVDSAAKDLATSLRDQPEVEGELRKVLGEVYYSIGAYDKAESQYRAAIERFSGVRGRRSAEVVGTMVKLTAVLTATNRHDDAIALSREAIDIARAVHGPASEEAADTTANLGAAVTSKDAKAAIAHLKDALALYDKLRGPDSIDAARVLEHLGQAEIEAGLGVDAERSLKRSYDIRAARLGAQHIDTVTVGGLLGDSYLAQQRYADAEPFCRLYAQKMASIMPPTQPAVPLAWASLALALHRQGKLGEAISLYRAQVEPLTKLLGPDDLNVGTLHNNLGNVLVDAGDYAAAETELQEALRVYRGSDGTENARMAFALLGLAHAKWGQEDYPSSERFARLAYQIAGRKLPAGHAQLGLAALRLAACQIEIALAGGPEAGALVEESETLAESAKASFLSTLDPDHFNVWLARARIACAHAAAAVLHRERDLVAAEKELVELQSALDARPSLGPFPAHDTLQIDLERVLGRLRLEMLARRDAATPHAETELAIERLRQRKETLAKHRASALASPSTNESGKP